MKSQRSLSAMLLVPINEIQKECTHFMGKGGGVSTYDCNAFLRDRQLEFRALLCIPQESGLFMPLFDFER